MTQSSRTPEPPAPQLHRSAQRSEGTRLGPEPEARSTIRDARGAVHRLDRAPRRVVSLVPSVTETLFALGCGDRVVAVTEFCTQPAAARERAAVVGGTKTPNIGAITELAPDLVIANREENRAIDVRRLEARGVPVFVLYARSVLRAAREVAQLGAILDTRASAAGISDEIRAALARRAVFERRVRTVALIWKSPYMAVGGDCYADDLIWRCGGENPFSRAQRRYPHVTERDLDEADPEVILLPDEPYAFCEADRAELLGLRCTAARRGRVHRIDGTLLTWPGPRSARAIGMLEPWIRAARA